MIHLNAGNLWTKEYLRSVIKLNEEHDDIKVKSLFGSIAKLTPTARSADRLPYLDWAAIAWYIENADKHDIAIRYTLNQSCIDSIQEFKRNWDGKLKEDVIELHSIGVHEWTITSPLLVELLHDLFPMDFIEVSTIAECATPEDAQRWMKLGASGVNVATSINRDIGMINLIRQTGITVSLLANEACLFRCPWRRECYNLSSHDSQRSEELFGFYPFSRCNEVRMAKPVEWLRSRMILPQWMGFYESGSDPSWFKIAYRTHPIEVALPILEVYMAQYHGGNLLDLWPTIARLGDTEEPKDRTYISCKEMDKAHFFTYFAANASMCATLDCGSCGYCESILDKTLIVG